MWVLPATLFSCIIVNAYDFECDGLYYNILSETDNTVETTYCSSSYDGNNYVSGEIEIPKKIIYKNKTYTVTAIGYHTFEYCDELTSVSIPNSITLIRSSAFGSCNSLTLISIPNSVISIEDFAFHNCIGLTTISIGNSVTSIGDGAFNGCIKLAEIAVDANNQKYCSINGILYSKDKTNLIRYPEGYKTSFFEIPNSVTSIGNYAFYRCTGLTSVSIPNSVTSIGFDAFGHCNRLTSVSIPNSVTSIGSCAFEFCTALTSASIPNSATSIGSSAFECCTALTSVTIGNSVTSIGDWAFSGCENLQYIHCMPTTPPKYNFSFLNDTYMNATLYVPVGTRSAYEKVDPWRNFWNIEEYDFSGVDDITIDDYSDCPVEIYNLSGNKVGSSKESLSPGIYIMRQGRKVEKIMIQ